jgi:branched-chain amino acid transport system ATP-binding protein
MLKLRGVEVGYGHIRALRDVSLEVNDGELVALLGANGAGKSSTLMTISGIVRPRAGTVFYGDFDLSKATPLDIVNQGIIHCPEGRRIFGSLSVQENLRMGAIRRRDRSRVAEDLEHVFSLFPVLGERRRQAGATLSGGEQQMLAIGRALMASPRLLLLDEPSLGLAPLVVRAIFRVIRELRARSVTILLVEQNIRQALAVADRAYVLETGRIVLSGTGAELRATADIEKAYLSGPSKEKAT